MLVPDTSSFIAYLQGESGPDVDAIEGALRDEVLLMAPPVVTELLSEPTLPEEARSWILDLPRLSIRDGFWERVGLLRARILSRNRKARLADSLIVQVCLDHEAQLVARDQDFNVFEKYASLNLLS